MRHKLAIITALMLLAVGAAYANSLHNAFEFDDFHTITDNPAVRSLDNLPRFFTDATTFSVLPANRTYRPVVSTSLALDYAMGHGYVPSWFHLSTMVWFLLLVWQLSVFYRLLTDRVEDTPENVWLGLFGAAWFGLHPAMAETVNYAIQRGDLYCTLGCVAGLLIYAGYPSLRKTGLYLLPLVLAMLSKPPAAVFPVLLGMYVYFFEHEDAPPLARMKHAVLAAVPAVAVTVALLVLQSAMTPKSFVPTTLSAAEYRLIQPFVWLRYAGELFLPLHLNVDSDLKASPGVSGPVIAGLLFAAALLVAIWFTARRRRLYPIAFGLLWFVVTLFKRALKKLNNWTGEMSGAVALASLLGLSGILVHSAVDFNLQIPANAALFYVLCTIAASEPFAKPARKRRVVRSKPAEELPESQEALHQPATNF